MEEEIKKRGDIPRVDFICVGGNKCATTWLSELLRGHPEVNVSENKEPFFFDKNFNKGFKWYADNWSDGNKKGLKGEFSTSYLYTGAIKKIAKYYPNVKIIIMLRNPKERAISHLKHSAREADCYDYESLIEKDPSIIGNSLYSKNIKRIFDNYKKKQIHIIFYDDVCTKPEEVYSEVCKYLDISPGYTPTALNRIVGANYKPRFRSIDKIKQRAYYLLKEYQLGWIINLSTKWGIGKLYKPGSEGFKPVSCRTMHL